MGNFSDHFGYGPVLIYNNTWSCTTKCWGTEPIVEHNDYNWEEINIVYSKSERSQKGDGVLVMFSPPYYIAVLAKTFICPYTNKLHTQVSNFLVSRNEVSFRVHFIATNQNFLTPRRTGFAFPRSCVHWVAGLVPATCPMVLRVGKNYGSILVDLKACCSSCNNGLLPFD